MSDEARCASISLSLEEPMFATASTVRNWILLEQPGPWGYHAVAQSHLPRGVARELAATARRAGVRVVLLRRPGGSVLPRRQCFFAHTGPARPWIERVDIDNPADLLDLDLTPLARGEPLGVGMAEEAPLFIVCTNGRRDRCCAERGRAVARALGNALGDRAWECSHIGGDRFAANLVCFPHGLYYGRVPVAEAVGIAESYQRGMIDLEHYRGRSCYDFTVQAADYFLRRRDGLRGLDDVTFTSRTDLRRGTVRVEFSGAGFRRIVDVEVSPAGRPRRLTCHADEELRPRTFRVATGEPVDGRPFDDAGRRRNGG